MQTQPAIPGLLFADLEILAGGGELDAGGRGGQQAQAIARFIPRLMDMPPKQGFHLWITRQPLQQFIGIAQSDGGNPRTADVYGLVVAAHQAMALACRCQRLVEQ
ncbi:hypothetical protein D3C76_1563440 [compost metagenome]